MSWEYNVKEHKFYLDGVYQFDADYAGASGYKNDPSQECVKNSGPLPRGKYTIGSPHNSAHTGKYTLSLTPYSTNEMCGRDSFKIHGKSSLHPDEALLNKSNFC
ncbi:tlde1 domain-containing protein [Enterobacter cloacae complex sp. 326A8]|uniref:tlde1 domain-containing protein n=1 Tax=Enterobacter cloacae complex sp. 326A8 TaxID=3395871 RepID=UPI003CF80005